MNVPSMYVFCSSDWSDIAFHYICFVHQIGRILHFTTSSTVLELCTWVEITTSFQQQSYSMSSFSHVDYILSYLLDIVLLSHVFQSLTGQLAEKPNRGKPTGGLVNSRTLTE